MRRSRPGQLEGKVVVVTGASSGVGRAIARLFGLEGAKVALIGRDLVGLEDAASEIRSREGQAMVLPLDVSQPTAVEAAADRVASFWGRIDVWVNDATPDEDRRVIEVSYLGYVHGTLSPLKHMRPANAGLIVQIGSAVAYRSIPLQSAYSASKAAIRGFIEALRSELIHERSGIRIVHLQLPSFNTPQFEGVALRAVLRPRREIWIGWSTMKAILGQRLIPRFLDKYLLPGDRGAHGPFDREALRVSGARGVVTRGLIIGAAGTLAVALAGIVERLLRGRRPIYAPARLTRRLFSLARAPRRATVGGALLRWTYGPLLGVIYSATLGRLTRRRSPGAGGPAARAWPAAGLARTIEAARRSLEPA